jgi:Na+/melibiose symporter-like transporter
VAVGGWRNVYTIIGSVMLAMALLWLVLYRETDVNPVPAQSRQGSEDVKPLATALKQKSFWLVFLGWPWTVLIWVGMFYYWPSYAQGALNMTAAQSGFVVGLIPIFSCVASLTAPLIAKKIGYDKPLIWPWGFILPVLYFMMMVLINLCSQQKVKIKMETILLNIINLCWIEAMKVLLFLIQKKIIITMIC